MSWANRITTTLFGSRFGLQSMTTNVSGSGRSGPTPDFLNGPEDIRRGVTTAETTATNLAAWGVSVAPGTSAASSAVYTIDPPIPGVSKRIFGGTANGPVFIKTANSETIQTTIGSSFTTIKISSLGGGFELLGLTTAIWMALGITSGTSSQASGFGVTTST